MLPLWVLHLFESTIWFPVGQMALTAIVVPGYLSVVGLRGLRLGVSAWIVFLLLFASHVTSVLIAYFDWGVAAGMLLRPDPVTVLIVEYEFILGMGISLLPVLLGLGFHTVRARFRTS